MPAFTSSATASSIWAYADRDLETLKPVTAYTGLDISSSATANTYGSYAQLVAASTITDPTWASGIYVQWTFNQPDQNFAVDLATGASASEVVVATVCGTTGAQNTGIFIPFRPIKLTGQPRLALRVKDTPASALSYTCHVQLEE